MLRLIIKCTRLSLSLAHTFNSYSNIATAIIG